MMEWRRSTPVTNDSLLREVERRLGITLPRDYVETALQHSGGAPVRSLFLVNGEERVFNRLLSTDASKHPNVLEALAWVAHVPERKLVPFATDPFGNLLCFSFITSAFCTIAWLDMADGTVVPLSTSFTVFINSLYDSVGGDRA